MTKRRNIALVAVGMAAGILATVLLGGQFGNQVQAQAPAPGVPAAVGRYQISAYGYSIGDGKAGSQPGPTGSQVLDGAYILDTQTGEVFLVTHYEALKSLGSVAKLKK